jgi:hypothetical protein
MSYPVIQMSGKMYNSKYILEEGREVYPGYFDKEKRKDLRN